MNSLKSQVSLLPDGVTPEAARSQLHRILSSSLFRDSPQLCRFLSFVVESVLSGQSHRITQHAIAVNACGFPNNFDPLLNTSIRVFAIRLRESLTLYYFQEGTQDDIRIEIPKGTYIPVIRRNLMQSKALQSGTSLSSGQIPQIDPGYSIAVISFLNKSPNENSFLADNFTESVVTGLVQFRELQIIGPLQGYKHRPLDPDEFDRRLCARFVLQGNVQIYNATVRVNAGLTDTRTGFKIWSQTYEHAETATSLIEMIDDIARRIVFTLADYGGVISCLICQESTKKPPALLDTQEAICRQMRYLRVFSPDAHRVAVEALTHTVKADPDNPMALAMLCNAYCHDYVFDIGSAKAPLEEAERLTQQALALDPKCQMAHISEAFLRFLQGYDEQCIDQIRWAYSLNPLNSYVNYISALMLCMSDRMEEGLCLLENTLELDPNHSTLLNSISFMQHYQQGNYEKAWSYAKRLNTSVFWHPLIRAASAAQLGLRDKANSSVQELLAMRPDFSFRAQDLIRRFTYREEHIELLLDGLWKAGLKLHLA